MSLCSVYVPQGAVGLGISWSDADLAINKLGCDVIACDAGSTDSGPYYLGTGKTKYARAAVKSDLKMMIVHGRKKGLPIIIGSCGTCGTDSGVDLYAEITKEILDEEGLTAKIAKIYSSQDIEYVAEKFNSGKFHALDGAPVVDKQDILSCSNIVALAGVEPFIKVLNEGADIVLCGRSTDTAIMAAVPLMKGVDPGVAWHVAKLIECGPVCTRESTRGGVIARFEKDSCVIEAVDPGNECSVYSVSAHLLYENSDPIIMVEPGIMIDTTPATYEQLPEGKVRVANATFKKMPYTLKLEGSRKAGFQTVTLVGVRDRMIMNDPEGWMEKVEEYTRLRMGRANINIDEVSYSLKPYGWNATYGGPVPEGYVPNELGFLLTVTAESQEKATQLAKAFNPALLHCPVDPNLPIPSFAFPFSPAEIERGEVYEFVLHHVIDVDDPMECIRFEISEE